MRRFLAVVAVLALIIMVAMVACPPARSAYVPRDRSLVALPLFFYPVRNAPAKAVLIFFGNDIAFWKAHEELATQLSNRGYDVVGIDIRKFISGLPSDQVARERAFASSISSIIERSVVELHAQSIPLVMGGHSYGADLAFWTAVHAPPQHLIGVLALSPTARSHFYITVADLANTTEPTESGSFSIAGEIQNLPSFMRVALLRGYHDSRRKIDSILVAAGGSRVRYTVIPLAGHSLKSMTIAGPITGRALDWVVKGQ